MDPDNPDYIPMAKSSKTARTPPGTAHRHNTRATGAVVDQDANQTVNQDQNSAPNLNVGTTEHTDDNVGGAAATTDHASSGEDVEEKNLDTDLSDHPAGT